MPRFVPMDTPSELAAVALPVESLQTLQFIGVAAAAFFVCGWLAWAAVEPFYERWERRTWAATKKQIADLRAMTWQEFEAFALAAFERAGWEGSITGGGGADNGVDLMLRKGALRVVVSCKHYKNRVGAPFVREAVGVAVHYRAKGVYVVALGGFTKAAKEYAAGKPVKLIDGAALLRFMNGKNR
ncbi:hypothetical protein GHK68_30245 [Sinorhizobium meliloti]|uniref:restriction endonuclease n=1 Tax=Rhizobium meliloti TaxID=382 RepID=UPI001294D595|nr:restriction endonuclease [Sinorhizobium meliloti]MQW46409.1 hypothetical protein [Sinorhizobium meliloti]